MPGSIHNQVESPSEYNLSQSTAPDGKGAFLQAASFQTQSPVAKGSIHPVARTQCQTASNHAITLHTCFGSPSLKTKHDFPSIPSAYPGPHPAEPEDPPGGSVRAREFAGIPGCCLAKGRSAHSRGGLGTTSLSTGLFTLNARCWCLSALANSA